MKQKTIRINQREEEILKQYCEYYELSQNELFRRFIDKLECELEGYTPISQTIKLADKKL